ncbi:MAG TPA: hypothetical protein VFJ74_08025 [Gemmatimonadaceae bacterium]|nr:hypothetical protein [Gemmatimonadaceae bacterium]
MTRRSLILAFAAAAVVGACARVVASAPPDTAPSVNQVALFEGTKTPIAARGARALQEFGFTTRRFGADSTWGYRSQSRTAARLRYASSSGDSTRVLIELWLPCGNGYGCGRGDFLRLVSRMQRGEETPSRTQ